MRSVTTVSYKGTKEDKENLEALAHLLNTTVGKLVRQAVDVVWQDELARVDEIKNNLFDTQAIAAKHLALRQGKCKAEGK